MGKIYGVDEREIKAIFDAVLNRKNTPLIKVFSMLAEKLNKSFGTIRNEYYFLAKIASENQDFQNRFTGGKAIHVSKIRAFSQKEEENLLSVFAQGKKDGLSVRKTAITFSGGNKKTYLRLMNKYRNVLKTNPEKVLFAEHKLGVNAVGFFSKEYTDDLKKEIDGLVLRVERKLKTENEELKKRVDVLFAENLRLKEALSEISKESKTAEFFNILSKEKAVH